MLKSIGSATFMLIIISALSHPAIAAEPRPVAVSVAVSATSARVALPTAARNWHDWFSGNGPTGNTSRKPVNIIRNPKAPTNSNQSVNSLLFTIDGLPGTWPGLKISTP